MTREEVRKLALEKIDSYKYLILELITGMGKTKVAIDLINHICDRVYKEYGTPTTVLILVAKRVHKETWVKEISKWGGVNTDLVTMECYESLRKYKGTSYDIVIADEMQHLSERRLEILQTITVNQAFIGLSATIKKDMRWYFRTVYHSYIIKCDLTEAIEDEVLPEPVFYLVPLKLDSTKYKYKAKRFKKDIITTQRGYYDIMSNTIDWYKRKYMCSRNERTKNMWLSMAGKRLKWLSEQKEPIVLSILERFRNYRTLTFCSGIEQSERLGKYNITSKNKDSVRNLEMFNANRIKHITACNILNEGVNLVNCRIGIFCNLNSSEIITKQRIGRLLRHKSPIVIFPYFINTREEELVQKIREYHGESINIVYDINDIRL